ncbi:phage tail protein I [Pseudocitrobacter cyperus]|uniref:Phage tail protein I n=1 Tax=Pseudocitrobacter cyperus TaxID=3112843 RepID=A0ABV0HIP0_9ENTR
MSDRRLLPVGSSPLEVAAAKAASEIERVPVPLRTLWNWRTCPVALLPYLAWALSVDRWDENWPEATKRNVISSSFYVHQHKGTISALRRVVEPLGYLIEVKEWWELDEEPGTFRLVVGVLDTGITDEMYLELERLIDGAKPASRHLTGLAISLSTSGDAFVGACCYDGDLLTIYPFTTDEIVVGGDIYPASAIHLIDNLRVSA